MESILSRRRVVITGLGIVSPVGNTVEQAWSNIIAGKSGITTIDQFDTTGFSVTIGGAVKNFNPLDYLAAKDIKKMDPFIHYGMAAGIQAIEDSAPKSSTKDASLVTSSSLTPNCSTTIAFTLSSTLLMLKILQKILGKFRVCILS